MNVGIIGYGYWGPNLVRNFSQASDCTVQMVADLNAAQLKKLSKLYPAIKTTTSSDELIGSALVDAVVIATPVASHFPLAKQALLQDKHVLIEKPMTTSVAQAQELLELAAKKNRVLMIDHTFLYTGPVQKIKALVDSGAIGKIQYIDSTRINLGLFQHDVNVLWDLAVHDAAIFNYVCNELPYAVQAVGISHTKNEIEDIAFLVLYYSSEMIAHISCSWISPVKIRQMLIGGDKRMIVYNDMEPAEKIKVYDTGYEVKTDEDRQKVLIDYRVGDIYSPRIELKEALALVAADFVSAVHTGRRPLSDGRAGLNVVRVLEASQLSIKDKGREVTL